MSPTGPMQRPLIALLVFMAAAIGFGIVSPDFGHARHPLALLGALGEPHALAFNLLGFVLPGALLAWLAWSLRGAHAEPGWRVRIGLQLVLLLVLGAGSLLPAPLAQRLAFLLWFGWWLLAARALNRP